MRYGTEDRSMRARYRKQEWDSMLITNFNIQLGLSWNQLGDKPEDIPIKNFLN